MTAPERPPLGDPEVSPTLWVVMPSYRDVPAFKIVRRDVIDVVSHSEQLAGYRVHFALIDDSAGLDPDISSLADLDDTTVLRAPFNLGHQRALVFGVRRLSAQMAAADLVVTLDADGEDRPVDLPRLLEPVLRSTPDQRLVALARRTSRQESLSFKAGYLVFRAAFRLLTGVVVRTGNFAAYRAVVAQQLLRHPYFDLCYSSSFISLDGPRELVPCPRGQRVQGKSRMNRARLVIHATRMLMPFLDRIAIRMLSAFAALFCLSMLGIAAILSVKLLSGAAIPGWATYSVLTVLVLSLVSVGNFVLLFASFAQSRGISLSNLEESVD